MGRHATDAGHTRRVFQHAAARHHLAQGVVHHRMHSAGIGLIPHQCLGNSLFLDKHGATQRCYTRSPSLPVTNGGVSQRLSTGLCRKSLAQGLGHRAGCLGGWVGKHIEQLARYQEHLAPENAALKHHGGIAQACATQANVQHIVVVGRRVVFQGGLLDIHVSAQCCHALLIGHGQRPPVVPHGGVQVHQVVGVKHNALHVHLSPTDPQSVKKTKVGALQCHGVGVSVLKMRCAAHGRHRHVPWLPQEWHGPS